MIVGKIYYLWDNINADYGLLVMNKDYHLSLFMERGAYIKEIDMDCISCFGYTKDEVEEGLEYDFYYKLIES